MSSEDKRKMIRIHKHDTSLEAIIAYYMDPSEIELTEKQEELRKRYRFVNQCLLNANNPKEIINKLMAHFQIGERQAWKDMANTKKLYGNISESDVKGMKYIHYQYALASYKKACLQRDIKSQLKAIELMHTLSGGDQDESFNPEKLKVFEYTVQLPEHIALFYEQQLKSGMMDFNKIPAEDAEFIEINS